MGLSAWHVSDHQLTVSPQYLAGDGTTGANASGTGNGAQVCAGASSIIFQVIDGGSWSGTITFQGSIDGTTFFSIPCVNLATGATETSTTSTSGAWAWTVGGLVKIQVTLSRSGGSVNVLASLAQQPGNPPYVASTATTIVPSVTSLSWTALTKKTNLDTTGSQIKNAAGKIGYVQVRNTSAADPIFVNIYDALTKTGTPKQFEVGPGITALINEGPEGLFACATGIFLTFSSNAADNASPTTALNAATIGYL